MQIRPYSILDCSATLNLFRQTVKTVNSADYTAFEIAAWLREQDTTLEQWHELLSSSMALVAVDKHNSILGFGNCLPETGLIDCLYVDAGHQKKGIGSLLLQALESALDPIIHTVTVYASLTSRGFFEHHGYVVVGCNSVHRSFTLNGVVQKATLLNFKMQKSR